MNDIFNLDYMGSSYSDDDMPDPLKRRKSKKKKTKQGGLANRLVPHPAPEQDDIAGHLGPHPVPEQDDNICPAEEQGDAFRPAVTLCKNTRPATEQGKDTTRPATKQGAKPRPVASLPMSIKGRLPRPWERQLPSMPFVPSSGMTNAPPRTPGLWRQSAPPWPFWPPTVRLSSMRFSADIGMPSGMPKPPSSMWKRKCLKTSDIGSDSGHGTP